MELPESFDLTSPLFRAIISIQDALDDAVEAEAGEVKVQRLLAVATMVLAESSQYVTDIREANKSAAESWVKATTPSEERAAILQLLGVLTVYGRDVLSYDGARLLDRLVSAIADLDVGAQSELFKRTVRKGRPGKTSFGEADMAAACAAVDILVTQGRPVDDTLTTVARRLKIQKGQLESWRKHFDARSKPHAKDDYRFCIEGARADPDGPEAYVEWLLRHLAPSFKGR